MISSHWVPLSCSDGGMNSQARPWCGSRHKARAAFVHPPLQSAWGWAVWRPVSWKVSAVEPGWVEQRIPKGLLSGRCVVGMALALGRHLSVYLRPL